MLILKQGEVGQLFIKVQTKWMQPIIIGNNMTFNNGEIPYRTVGYKMLRHGKCEQIQLGKY